MAKKPQPVKNRNPIANLVKQAKYHQRIVEDKRRKANKLKCRIKGVEE